MKIYLIALATGILVGVIYASLHVRSPAPPVIALIGLLGILIGEQIVPTVKRIVAGEPITAAWFTAECIPKITGTPATGVVGEQAAATSTAAVPPPSAPSHSTKSGKIDDPRDECGQHEAANPGKRDV